MVSSAKNKGSASQELGPVPALPSLPLSTDVYFPPVPPREEVWPPRGQKGVLEKVSAICKEKHHLEPQSLESLYRESPPWEVSKQESWKLHRPKGQFPSTARRGQCSAEHREEINSWSGGFWFRLCLEVAVICTISVAPFSLMFSFKVLRFY